MSQRVFVQVQCRPGTAYQVASTIAEREVHSSLYSTSGEYDLFVLMYIPDDEDVGQFINTNLLDVDGIVRTLTTLTFNAF